MTRRAEDAPSVPVEITGFEAVQLDGLVRQLLVLIDEQDTAEAPTDPAIARLLPDAYSDDVEAAAQFRRLTADDLLAGKRADATVMRATLEHAVASGKRAPHGGRQKTTTIFLNADQVEAWLRTITGLRLVLASRLGIRTEADHGHNGPLFTMYEWLGYRLELLIRAADELF